MKAPELFTSRYSAKDLILASGLAPVRISVGHPRWKLAYELAGVCRLLMPTRPMLRMEQEPYRAMYFAILDGHGPEKIEAELASISEHAGGKGLVLLCFEDLAKPGEWCHRRHFAEWWEAKTGQVVAELGADVARQAELF